MDAEKFPYISQRTKNLVKLALSKIHQDEESDSDIDSDDSYIPENVDILPPITDYEEDVDSLPEDNNDEDLLNELISIAPQNVNDSSDDVEILPRRLSCGVQRIDSDDESESEPTTYFGKKNCFSWSSIPQHPVGQTRKRNIIKVRLQQRSGPALTLGTQSTPEEVWRLFITHEMVKKIVIHTNAKMGSMRSKLENTEDVCYKDTNEEEIDALLGIMVFCSIFKSSRESLSSLFDTSISGRPLFRAIMTEKRCSVLLRALRFDDSATRADREKKDKGACISDLLNDFASNCQKNYSPGAHMTVDETLVPFRGRVKFLVYNPRKPAKYGIKLMCLADAHNCYLYNFYMYTGKGSDGASLSDQEKNLLIPTQAVIHLSKDLFGTNRNITCDNWFVSVQLAEVLLENGLTLVGTMKKNKPQIPPEFQPNKKRAVLSSLYGYNKDFTLLSYVPKKNSAVVLLSSMHHSDFTDTRTNKPEIISFYNATKGGVDALDLKCRNYSANRKTRRWPLAVFYHVIAVASSNAHILHSMFIGNKKMTRYNFTRQAAFGLVHNYLQTRLEIVNLPNDLRAIISQAAEEATKLGGDSTRRRLSNDGGSTARSSSQQTSSNFTRSDKLERRVTCRFCPYQKKRKAGYKCIKCHEATCAECSRKICKNCV